MSCNNCTTHTNNGAIPPKGCKNHGTCGTDGCNKLSVFDWLANISLPNGQEKFDCVEVRFKNSRKEFFRNTEKLPLQMGDVVATEAQSGHDVGVVTLTGELVRVQMQKKKTNPLNPSLPKIYRKANQKDIEIWQEARKREEIVQKKSRELAIALGLEMKISDVEFQGDGSKATFYYTAENRVDFRQLIKDMAREFSTRIEMRQIGFRQEAARLGGVGSCGRELCCSTWLTDFRSVTTAAARYQQLSLNPQKLAGQCGKLKCCLNYELDSYLDALKDFPKTEIKLHTQKGIASCQKVDIFKRLMWFMYEDDFINWHKLTVEQVKEILILNETNKPVVSLEEYTQILTEDEPTLDFKDTVGQESLTRFDTPKTKKRRGKKKTNNIQPSIDDNINNNSETKTSENENNAKQFNDKNKSNIRKEKLWNQKNSSISVAESQNITQQKPKNTNKFKKRFPQKNVPQNQHKKSKDTKE